MPREHVRCPHCNAQSPLVDWVEVDVGVGAIRGEKEWECPKHGVFAFVIEPLTGRHAALFRDWTPGDAA